MFSIIHTYIIYFAYAYFPNKISQLFMVDVAYSYRAVVHTNIKMFDLFPYIFIIPEKNTEDNRLSTLTFVNCPIDVKYFPKLDTLTHNSLFIFDMCSISRVSEITFIGYLTIATSESQII